MRLFVYLLLAFSLVVIGLPAYGAAASIADNDVEMQTSTTQDCPFHKAPQSDAQAKAFQSEAFSHDCCGPDCRCACASLSMLFIQRFQAPLSPLPPNLPQSADSLIAMLHGSRLLRPPQA